LIWKTQLPKTHFSQKYSVAVRNFGIFPEKTVYWFGKRIPGGAVILFKSRQGDRAASFPKRIIPILYFHPSPVSLRKIPGWVWSQNASNLYW
jgi:hypothetical protein